MDSCVIACLKHHCEKVILQYPVVMLPIPDRYSSLMILLINILARSRLRRRYLAYSHRQLPILEARQYSTLLCYSCTPSQPQQPGRSWGFHSVVRITPPQMRKWSAYLSIPSNSCKQRMIRKLTSLINVAYRRTISRVWKIRQRKRVCDHVRCLHDETDKSRDNLMCARIFNRFSFLGCTPSSYALCRFGNNTSLARAASSSLSAQDMSLSCPAPCD
ncbi:hypothetical protein F5B17DRAFT_264827 [Nemania serpens]|nr:hypothetical protein F5B17DRAFT_264827 [Nemania serpens]